MSSTFCGSVFVALAAFFLGALGCSDAAPQKEANSAETRSQAGFMLAGVAPPERCEGGQPQQKELDGEKPKGKVVEIPLDQIIGLGIRRLRVLEPELFVYRDTPEKVAEYLTAEGVKELEQIQKRAAEESLVLPIERALSELPTGKNTKPAQGFAVNGSKKEVLQGVHDVLVKGEKPSEAFPVETDVYVVFYSHPVQPFVGIDYVELDGDKIKIHYVLVSHGYPVGYSTLVLIPCGRLPLGRYQVEMIRSQDREKFFNKAGFPAIESGFEQEIICQPFSFSVVGPEPK